MKDKNGLFTKLAVCVALLLVAYIPTIKWMYERWMEAESYYSHGFLIPLVSLYFVWQKKDMLKKVKVTSAISGLWIIIAAILINILCAALRIYFVSGFTFICAIYGLVLFFFGKEIARSLRFPVFFLFTMIPLPLVLIGNLTVKLKLFATQAATFILNMIGFPSIRDGSIIRMPNSYLEVAAPCSGLRSLIALLTLGLLFAYTAKMSRSKRAILFLSSVPIAIATNVVRIVLIATVNDLYGEKLAMGLFHDITGFVVFALAFLALLGVSRILGGSVYEK